MALDMIGPGRIVGAVKVILLVDDSFNGVEGGRSRHAQQMGGRYQFRTGDVVST
jgi:hypothetical protein